MVEIWSLGVGPSEDYARAEERFKEFRETYHIPPSAAGIVAFQTVIRDLVPKPSAIDLLMGTFKKWKPWSLFEIPPNFNTQPRSRSHYVVPSLGSREKQEADVHKLETIIKTSGKSIANEGQVLIKLLKDGTIPMDAMTDDMLANMLRFLHA